MGWICSAPGGIEKRLFYSENPNGRDLLGVTGVGGR
jgi:hypothetical protein